MTLFTVLFIIMHIYCFFRASSAKPVMILQPTFITHLFQCSRIVHSLLATNTAAPAFHDFRNLIFQTETYPRSQPEIPDQSVCSQTLTLENVTTKATGKGNVLEMICGKQSHTDLEINLVWEVWYVKSSEVVASSASLPLYFHVKNTCFKSWLPNWPTPFISSKNASMANTSCHSHLRTLNQLSASHPPAS